MPKNILIPVAWESGAISLGTKAYHRKFEQCLQRAIVILAQLDASLLTLELSGR